MNSKTDSKQIPTTISKLVIPYLEKYKNRIVGIYLSPYQLGDKTKIEIDIISKQSSKIKVEKELNINKNTNNLTIYVKINNYEEYIKNKTKNIRKKLDKDLKSGYIIYDPNGILKSKQNKLMKQEEITPFINSSQLDESIIQSTINKLTLVKKK